MVQIILTSIFYIWLFLVVFLLWRHAIGAGERARKVTILLAESSQKSAEAALKAADAVQKLTQIMEQHHVE